MTKRVLLIALPFSLALLGVFFLGLAPDLGIASWPTPPELKVDPPTKVVSPGPHAAALALTGSGLEPDTRAWLVPETNQRLAVRKVLKTGGQPRRMVLSGDRVYLANNNGGLLLVDVSDWAAPKLLGTLSQAFHALDLAVRDQTVFLAAGLEGLLIVDCSDPRTPRLIGRLRTPGPATTVALAGETVYLGCARNGVQVVDVSRPAHPTPIGQLDVPALITDLAVAETTLLVAAGARGLYVVDVGNPRTTSIRQRLSLPGFVSRVVAAGNLFLCGSTPSSDRPQLNSLGIYRLASAASLQLQSVTPLTGPPIDIFVSGSRVDLALIDNGVVSYAIDDPQRPVLLRKLENYDRARTLVSAGNWLLLSGRNNTLQLVHAGDELQLPITGKIPSVPTSSMQVGLRTGNGRLFVATKYKSLEIFDVADPAAPRRLARLPLPGTLYELQLHGDRLWLGFKTGGDGGLVQAWSLQDPQQPRLLEELSLETPVGQIAVNERWLVVAEFRNDRTTIPATATVPPRQPGRLHAFDLGLPAPERRGTVLGLPDDPQALVLSDDTLLALAGNTLHAVQLTAGVPPRIVDQLSFSWLHAKSPRKLNIGIELHLQTAIFASSDTELAFVDVSTPGRLGLLGTIEMPGPIADIALGDDLLLVGLYDLGIATYDIVRPWQPQQLGILPVPSGSQNFAVSGSTIWLGGNLRFGVVGVPRPARTVVHADARGDRIELSIPRPQAAGDYSLWLERDNQWREVPNCLRFDGRG